MWRYGRGVQSNSETRLYLMRDKEPLKKIELTLMKSLVREFIQHSEI